jgi:hypothetical protein
MRRRKEIHKRKARSAPVREVPLWLRRLDRVKAELKATRFPATAEEGFRQCVALSTAALRFRGAIRHAHLGVPAVKLRVERRLLLACLI